MKRYTLVLVVLLVLVAVLGLPPRYYASSWMFRQAQRTPERIEAVDLESELLKESWLYQRMQWRDSVSHRLMELPEGKAGYLVELPPGTPDSLHARLEAGVRTHLSALDADPPRVPVGVFLLPRDTGLHPASRKQHFGIMWDQREIYVAREGEPPFCAVLEAVGRGDPAEVEAVLRRLVFLSQDGGSESNTLRLCGFYARYGRPGREVEKWLHEGGALFGLGVNMSRRSLVFLSVDEARGPFGLRTGGRGISHTGMGCLAGVSEACEEAFLRGPGWWGRRYRSAWEFTEMPEGSPVDYLVGRWYDYGEFGQMDAYIFQSLQNEFGPERFESFWRSSAPVPEAFSAAFGLSVGSWTMAWARELFGPIDRGPGVPLNASLLTFLTVGLLGALGLAMDRRRG